MVTSQAAASEEHLTWDEIRARYPDQWVVLVDIARENRNDFAFTGATVIAAFVERKAATPTIKELHAEHRGCVACFYTGKLIKGDIDPLWHRR